MPKEWLFMKLKQALIYLGGFLLLSGLFIICYYMSYMHALKEFNKKAIERNEELYSLLDNKTQPSPVATNTDVDTVPAANDVIKVLPTTKYTLETYNMKTDTTTTQELNPPAYLVGLTRQEVIDYLASYMKDLPLSEYNKGLIAAELIYFSDEEIIIRKSYNEDFLPYRYYVVIKDGYIVVYNSDLKSIYRYTSIEAKTLPEEDRLELMQGIYVNSLDELYSLLESYSS
jgi:hypothetical protein